VQTSSSTGDGDPAEDSVTVESCWEEVYSASLASAPSGITSVNGSWGGHSYSSKDGVSCLYQSSDWNVSYIPVTRGSTDYERIEIDVWWPGSSSYRSFDVYAFGEQYGTSDVYDALWFGSDTSNSWIIGGDTTSSSTKVADWSKNIISTGQWVSLAFEVDHSAVTVDFDVDGTAKANALVISDSAWVSGTQVVLSSDGLASSVSADTCWANLVIYESEVATDCFD